MDSVKSKIDYSMMMLMPLTIEDVLFTSSAGLPKFTRKESIRAHEGDVIVSHPSPLAALPSSTSPTISLSISISISTSQSPSDPLYLLELMISMRLHTVERDSLITDFAKSLVDATVGLNLAWVHLSIIAKTFRFADKDRPSNFLWMMLARLHALAAAMRHYFCILSFYLLTG